MCATNRFTFKKHERLKHRKDITALFKGGSTFFCYPVKIFYLFTGRATTTQSPVLAGFTVPKKLYKLSVTRHLLRRRMVEAWRLNKQALYACIPPHLCLHLFFVYTAKEELPYSKIEPGITKAIANLIVQSAKTIPPPAGL